MEEQSVGQAFELPIAKQDKKVKFLDIIIVINLSIIVILMLVIASLYLISNYFKTGFESIVISNTFQDLETKTIYDIGIDIDQAKIDSRVKGKIDDMAQMHPIVTKISDSHKFANISLSKVRSNMNDRVYNEVFCVSVENGRSKQQYYYSTARLVKNDKIITIDKVIKEDKFEEFKALCEKVSDNIDYNNFSLFSDKIRLYTNSSEEYIEIYYEDITKYIKNGVFKKENVKDYDSIFSGTINPYEPMIALTFDDGPTVGNTRRILDVLTKYDSKATFFVVGYMVDQNPNMLNEIKNQGSQIGNHTKNHLNLKVQSASTISEEVGYVERKILEITGTKCTALRPPYGNKNELVSSLVSTPLILWDIDTLDWKTKNAEMVKNHILENVKDGDIILMHDLYSTTADAVEMVVPILKERGYQMVTIDELLMYKEYKAKAGEAIRFVN